MAIHLAKHSGTTGWITWENVTMILLSGLPQQDIDNKEKLINIWIIMTLKMYAWEAMYEERNTDALSRDHCWRWKARSISYSERVSVVLLVQYEELMHSIIHVLSCMTIRLYSILLHYLKNVTIFGEKKLSKKTRVFWFSAYFSFETFLTLWRIRWDIIILYCT
jgi:hypothetical protein